MESMGGPEQLASQQLVYIVKLRTAALDDARSVIAQLGKQSANKDIRIKYLEQEAVELRADHRAKNDLFIRVCAAVRTSVCMTI